MTENRTVSHRWRNRQRRIVLYRNQERKSKTCRTIEPKHRIKKEKKNCSSKRTGTTGEDQQNHKSWVANCCTAGRVPLHQIPRLYWLLYRPVCDSLRRLWSVQALSQRTELRQQRLCCDLFPPTRRPDSLAGHPGYFLQRTVRFPESEYMVSDSAAALHGAVFPGLISAAKTVHS